MDALFLERVDVQLGGQTYWLQALSDFDLQARDEHALLAFARKRRDLADPHSDDYLRYVGWLEAAASDDQLKNIILQVATNDLQRQAVQQVQPKFIVIPDDATDDEKADTLAKRKAEAERVVKERVEFVKGQLDQLTASLAELDHAELLQRAKSDQINLQARSAYVSALEDYTLYAVAFRDAACAERLFQSPEEVTHRLNSAAKQAMLTRFSQNLDRLNALDLKYFLATVE